MEFLLKLALCCTVGLLGVTGFDNRLPGPLELSNGLCWFGSKVDCCWGWKRVNWGECQPVCESGCKNGDCVGPDKCKCHAGYTGKTCNQDVNECGLKPRPCKHRCVNTLGSYKCYCLNGYMMMPDNTCQSRTCALANCQYGCEMKKGEVRCLCPSPGLRLGPDHRTCVDVDECATGLASCPRSRQCVNTFGSYLCTCHPGFTLRYANGRYRCISDRSLCFDTPGSRKCKCKEMPYGKGLFCRPLLKINIPPRPPRITIIPPDIPTTSKATTTKATTTKATTTKRPTTKAVRKPIRKPTTTIKKPPPPPPPPTTTTTRKPTTTTTTRKPTTTTASTTTPPPPPTTTTTTIRPTTTKVTTRDTPTPTKPTTLDTTLVATEPQTTTTVATTTTTTELVTTVATTTTPITTTTVQPTPVRVSKKPTAPPTTTPLVTTVMTTTVIPMDTTTFNNNIVDTPKPRGDVHIRKKEKENNVFDLDFDIELGLTGEYAKDQANPGSVSCSFDEGVCPWLNDKEGDVHWESRVDPTGGRYLAVGEGRWGGGGRSVRGARLTIPFSTVSGPLCLTFRSHMIGYQVGTLQVFAKKGPAHHGHHGHHSNAHSTALWTRTGGHGWRHAHISMQGRGLRSLVIKGEKRKGRRGEVAIDDLSLRRGLCST
ncbi:nephronectin isoform X2 [Engraulis encrasicolus]|uniref:nephronectin isoform X2 n=1 Tax=Engraulis encrasicolus TaxID=184585 RepID=UPI002FD38B79